MAVRKAETFPAGDHGPYLRPRLSLSIAVRAGCHHSATLRGDDFPDDLPVRSLFDRMVCTRCGYIGADVRPDWSPHVNKQHA
jgi:hypothetical protein